MVHAILNVAKLKHVSVEEVTPRMIRNLTAGVHAWAETNVDKTSEVQRWVGARC